MLDFLSLCDWLVVDTIPTAGEETERRESDRGKWCDRLTPGCKHTKLGPLSDCIRLVIRSPLAGDGRETRRPGQLSINVFVGRL